MAHRQRHGHGGKYAHAEGAVDPSIATSERGIWAVKWSFVGLFATALVQAVVVAISGSIALLSDTIHNFGDAATAIPLWIAFSLARLGASRRFTFGYGRVEDLAGVVVVLISMNGYKTWRIFREPDTGSSKDRATLWEGSTCCGCE